MKKNFFDEQDQELFQECRRKLENLFNMVTISGYIQKGFKFSHVEDGKIFYKTILKCRRISGGEDIIPIVISKELLEKKALDIYVNEFTYVKIIGQFRCLRDGTVKQRYLKVDGIKLYKERSFEYDINFIYLDGFVYKPVITQKTKPTQIAVKVIRNLGEGSYDIIYCFSWKNLEDKNLKVGDRLKITGRIKSRIDPKSINKEYQKLTYEVTIKNIVTVKEEVEESEEGL